MRKIDFVIALLLGISIHDIASIVKFHIDGLHAIYVTIPLLILLFLGRSWRYIWEYHEKNCSKW